MTTRLMGMWRPAHGARLGQISDIVTGELAKRIVQEAEPATRRIVRDERNRLAEALIGGIPYAALSALAFVGTSYFVPSKAAPKAIGYATSAALLGVGAWKALERLTETAATVEAPAAPAAVTAVVNQTAQAIVREAEPRIRQIVADERSRIATATQAGLPLAVGALAVFAATMFLVPDKDKAMKAIGYSGSALLLGSGAWIALDETKQAA